MSKIYYYVCFQNDDGKIWFKYAPYSDWCFVPHKQHVYGMSKSGAYKACRRLNSNPADSKTYFVIHD